MSSAIGSVAISAFASSESVKYNMRGFTEPNIALQSQSRSDWYRLSTTDKGHFWRETGAHFGPDWRARALGVWSPRGMPVAPPPRTSRSMWVAHVLGQLGPCA